MKKIIAAVTVLICLLALCLAPVGSDMEIYDKLIRIHVLADSDSPEDQALKLKVRDGLLETVSEMTEGCATKEEAETVLTEGIPVLEEIALQVLKSEGSTQGVEITLGKESYPERTYEGLRLPAGEYTSLKVMIGEAEGKNWWCVLFPPLCVGSATQVEEKMVSVGFTPDQVKVLTDTDSPKYRIRFKLLDVLGSIFS